MQQTIQTLYQFILKLFTDPSFAAEQGGVKAALKAHGHGDISPEELHQAMALVADELPADQARLLTAHLQQAAVGGSSGGSASGSINVNQGGGSARAGAEAAAGGAPAAPGVGGTAPGATAPAPAAPGSPAPVPPAPIAGEDPLDAVVREITIITNNISNVSNTSTITETNTTNIDDRDTIVDNSVRQSINAGGDVNLDQDITNNTASGDGAVAGEVGGNVNTGENSGIVGDAQGARVTNVEGDGNTLLGDIGDGANVVTGEVGQFVGGDASGANLIGGDNSGLAAAGSEVTGAVIGDGNTTLAGNLSGNLNLGGDQRVAEGSGNNLGDGDLINAQNSTVNTGDGADTTDINLTGFSTGGGAVQVNAGGGSNASAVDASETRIDTTQINQEATVNQVQNLAADGSGAGADGGQFIGVELEAGDDASHLGVEVEQDGSAEATSPAPPAVEEVVEL